jgi:TonB family protein
MPAPIEMQRARWAHWAEQLHAVYSVDADKHTEQLEVYPVGFGSDYAESLSTTIDVPFSLKPPCRLEMAGRCLIAVLTQTAYPQEALLARAGGSIVLTGTIKRDGAVAGLRVVNTDIKPEVEEESLAKAALQNLEKWQFDAADRDDPLRITYSYAIETSLSPGTPAQVDWDLPNQVIIRAPPPEGR